MERHEIEAGFAGVDRCRWAKRKLACQPNPEGYVKAKANWSSIFSARVIAAVAFSSISLRWGIISSQLQTFKRSNV
jgi:hypothetical protein